MANSNHKNNLDSARKNKNDEFYTSMEVIEQELKYHKKSFRNKVVFCNCDDPYESNFFKYFCLNFNVLKLKQLICTCYGGSKISGTQLTLFDDEQDKPLEERNGYMLIIDKVKDLDGDGAVTMNDIQMILKNKKTGPKKLKGDGDFRSEECIELLKNSDIVCSNPPFSLWRPYLEQLIKYDKKFLIIGNINATCYKEVFPLIQNNRLWLGASIHSGDREFRVPDDYPLKAAGCRVDENGNKYIRVKGVRWFTNLDYKERHDTIPLYKKYDPEAYPKYDNCDAINVDKTNEIPEDYDGLMGVPITFLDNTTQSSLRS